MSNIAVCPGCDRELKLPQGADGRKIRCPSCKTPLLVSDGERSLVGARETNVRAGRPERRSRLDDEDEAPRRSRRADPEDRDYDRPRKRRKRSRGGIPLWAWLTGGGVLLAAVLGLVIILLLNKGDGYEKIKTGMSETEVIAIMGNPTESVTFGNFKLLGWKQFNKGIVVYLQDGKVWQKMKVDLRNGKVDLNDQHIDVGDGSGPGGNFGGGNGFMGGGPGQR